MEIFKDVVWYEWLYQVSNTGKVKSFCKVNNKNLKPRKDTRWYLKVVLCKNTIWKQYFIHRLVALHFIHNDCMPQVNHIDGDKTNNHVSNLEWCTSSENMKHSYNISLRKSIFWSKHVKSRSVNQLTLDGAFIKKWWCMSDIERSTWLSNSTISKVCQWKIKTSWWFLWRYADEQDV